MSTIVIPRNKIYDIKSDLVSNNRIDKIVTSEKDVVFTGQDTASEFSTETRYAFMGNNNRIFVVTQVAGGSDYYRYYSDDLGKTFTKVTTDTYRVNKACYNDDSMIAILSISDTLSYAYSTDNGLDFSTGTITSTHSATRLVCTFYDNGYYYILDNKGWLHRSSDLTSFTEYTQAYDGGNINDTFILYIGSKILIMIRYNTAIITSSNSSRNDWSTSPIYVTAEGTEYTFYKLDGRSALGTCEHNNKIYITIVSGSTAPSYSCLVSTDNGDSFELSEENVPRYRIASVNDVLFDSKLGVSYDNCQTFVQVPYQLYQDYDSDWDDKICEIFIIKNVVIMVGEDSDEHFEVSYSDDYVHFINLNPQLTDRKYEYGSGSNEYSLDKNELVTSLTKIDGTKAIQVIANEIISDYSNGKQVFKFKCLRGKYYSEYLDELEELHYTLEIDGIFDIGDIIEIRPFATGQTFVITEIEVIFNGAIKQNVIAKKVG